MEGPAVINKKITSPLHGNDINGFGMNPCGKRPVLLQKNLAGTEKVLILYKEETQRSDN